MTIDEFHDITKYEAKVGRSASCLKDTGTKRSVPLDRMEELDKSKESPRINQTESC